MDKKFTVCFITPRAKKNGGAEESLITIIKFLKKKDIDIKLIMFEENGTLLDELKKLEVEFEYIPAELWIDLPWQTYDKDKFKRIFEQSIEVANQLREWKVDLVYTNTSVTNIGALAATVLNIPHIWHIRESIKDHPSYKIPILFESLSAYINSSSNAVIYISKYLKDQYTQNYKNPNSSVIYNRVEVDVQDLKPVDKGIKTDVIIPFYKDESILQCLDSVKKHKSESLNKVYVIDDRGPDLELAEKVKEFVKANSSLFEYLQNDENKGFVYTCNRGMKLNNNDVVLLNSDTIVTQNWLEKIKTNIYQSEEFATSTALSNAASYYSIPDQFNKEYDNDPELMNKIVEEFSPYKYIQTHASHGFCMYIKRSTIEKVGYFDEESFGKGYGEEVDFSMRALNNGMKNIVSTNTYIHHWEGRSFGNEERAGKTKKEIIKEKSKIILERYPNIHKLEEEFHKRNQLADIKNIVKYFKNHPEVVDAEKVVMIGSVEENKGQLDGIKLLDQLHKEGGSQHLIIVGPYDESPYFKSLQEYIKNAKLERFVHFIGFINMPWEILRSAQCVINASRSEGFGRSALEVMLLKTPLISTRVGGLAEFVLDTTAFIYEAENIDQLYQGYKKAIQPKTRNKIVEAAYIRAFNLQSNSNYEGKIFRIIDGLREQINQNAGFSSFFSPWLYTNAFDRSILRYMEKKIKGRIKNSAMYRFYKRLREKAAIGTRIRRVLGKQN